MCILLLQHISRRSTITMEVEDHQIGRKCLFITQLQLETEGLEFEPSAHQFQQVLAETLERFQDCTLALPNLTPDKFFHAFTR